MTRKKQDDAPKDSSRQFQVLADDIDWLMRNIAQDRELLEKRLEGLYSCISDQHEINQMLTDRLFILESENVHVSASIH